MFLPETAVGVTYKPARYFMKKNPFRKLKGSTLFLLSYLIVIFLGGFLLWLPVSNPGLKISFLDTLFTATSALCVTGLNVVDTGAYSFVGQILILILIQAGGLGITTFSVWLFLSLSRDVGFQSRFFIQATFSRHPTDQLRQLLRLIFRFTFLIEGIGALLLFSYWIQKYSLPKALYLSIFHSISAFCNAGFSLFSDNLMKFQDSLTLNLTVAGLIILGGIGFPVVYELVEMRKRKAQGLRVRISLNSRLVLVTTFLLIFGGTLLLYGIEYNNSLKGHSVFQGLLVAFFHSVSARTAGFNTIDLNVFTNAVLLILIILMFIGASPGSCGGGIKTTTLALLGGLFWNRLQGKVRVSLYKRTLPEEVISRVMALFALSCVLVLIITTLILMVEKGRLVDILFEVVSAYGTVGLSLGVTPSLAPVSKLLIILTMFLGRVGILSLGYALAKREDPHSVLYGEEGVMVG
jgi:trk system potassium uptake protein TrkH